MKNLLIFEPANYWKIKKTNIAEKKIFLTIGMLVTFLGVLSGTVLGLVFCFLQQQFELVRLGPENAFFIDAYPIKVNLTDIIIIQTIVVLLGLITSYVVSQNNRFYTT